MCFISYLLFSSGLTTPLSRCTMTPGTNFSPPPNPPTHFTLRPPLSPLDEAEKHLHTFAYVLRSHKTKKAKLTNETFCEKDFKFFVHFKGSSIFDVTQF